MKKGVIKKILLSITCVILSLVIVVGCYLEYVILQYYRIEDYKSLEIVNKSDVLLDMDDTFKITTYNIGFGAYNRDFSFF